ncbi:MAG: hypothetical protein COB02_12615 [Candidatus Cloacimonadota bacterium]|nr:MAG: hypothetical protein COB02_12615 [Candidatus Cloacimonadota bacterium]
MKHYKKSNKGAFILIAIGMMVLVSFLTTSELETLNIMVKDKRSKEYQQAADIAARSGIDYGYSMLKNVMESMSIIDLRFATHFNTDFAMASASASDETVIAEIPPSWQEIINFLYDEKARKDRRENETNMTPTSNHGGRLWPGTDSHYLRLNSEMRQILGGNSGDGGLCKDGSRANCINEVSNPYEESIDPRIPIDAVLRPQLGVEVVNDFTPGNTVVPIKSEFVSLQYTTNVAQIATMHRQIPNSRPDTEADFSNDLLRDCPVEFLLSDDPLYNNIEIWHLLAPEPAIKDLRPEGIVADLKWGEKWPDYDHCDYRFNVLREKTDDVQTGFTRKLITWDDEASPRRTTGGALVGDAAGSDPSNLVSPSEQVSYDYGHLQTRRWHYYNDWNFQFSNTGGYDHYDAHIESELINGGAGTGGTIIREPTDMVNALDFDRNKEILFDRLINRSIDYSSTLTYPFEPADAREQYNVGLQTVLDLDLDDDGTNNTLFDETIYDNIRYKTFFKLWLTRDTQRDGYGGSIKGAGKLTSSFIQDVPLRTYDGKDIFVELDNLFAIDVNRPTDLHPMWALPREDGLLPMPSPASTLFGSTLRWRDTSYWKPDYARDFLDTNANGDHDEYLGVLQFPMPYLSYQRGDVDYWSISSRGNADITTVVAESGPAYTFYSLWSLGEVKIVTDSLSNLTNSRAPNEIFYSDFQTVARVLYRMDFHIDIRSTDVEDKAIFQGARMNATTFEWTNENIQDGGVALTDDLDCTVSSLRADTLPTLRTNRVNEAYYASRLIPICDLDSRASTVSDRVYKHTEPEGISVKQIIRVPYRSSTL